MNGATVGNLTPFLVRYPTDSYRGLLLPADRRFLPVSTRRHVAPSTASRGRIGCGQWQGIWSVPEIVVKLTPAGVGAIVPGDKIEARIDGVAAPTVVFGPPEE
jgi:hypothetical protein